MSRLAATIFQIYVASDTASDSLAGLKRLHGIMPYFVLKGILKISNPMAMIRGELAHGIVSQADIQAFWTSSSRVRLAARVFSRGGF